MFGEVEFVAHFGECLVQLGRCGQGLVLVLRSHEDRERDVRPVELAESALVGGLQGVTLMGRTREAYEEQEAALALPRPPR
ncbi:hypothetical protein [Streptomyces sp. NPDC004726]